RNIVSHNAYTQVAAEMGIAALVLYVMFILVPFKRLREIERETYAARRTSQFYYLAVALQASLIGYMVSSFFLSVAYGWHVYYLVGYAVCLRRLYQPQVKIAQGSVDAPDVKTSHNSEQPKVPARVRPAILLSHNENRI
ncbi:MAG: hypothetical protein H0T92_11175, partial [Pyrinomonadaceae bacterium]|nr:hypothetical protein [Pyrinomonadaceae bacterium]